ncbi:MAG: uracil-DNA glycosylase [Anaerolineae bacterium]|nr:uracil-DNA glycosylase [Anaerolineae bacterium]
MADERAEALAKIAAEIRTCTLCDLHKNRTRAVPGAGDIHATIMFIGEGPGYNEDRQGLPFVGRSGTYLEALLKLINLTRNEVFITNVVKCRPPENRDPLPVEINTCKPYLDQQINLIDPLIIVTLGRFSMARYFPNGRITQIHGQAKIENGRAYYPLFHPAAVLRNPSLQSPMEVDFKRIPEVVDKVRELRNKGQKPPSSAAEDAPPPTQRSLF